jgi:glycosyltransferase involved in cell wall biosynthesis
MNVAVLSLTRDRLDYTRHCFASLVENAGVEFDWLVLDQGSTDGTVEWLRGNITDLVLALPKNVGICRGLNMLLDRIDLNEVDVVVRFDNDCEVTQPDTLKMACEAAMTGTIVAPRVLGLRQPPPTIGSYQAGGRTVDETSILGGIFMAIPATVFRNGFRYDENSPPWSGDEKVCEWFRQRGGRCGYLQDVSVNHYRTTEGQHADIPDYFARKRLEGCPV